MKRFYMINYLLCGICLLWMTGCSNMLDEMRPKDKIPQDALSESDLTKLLNGVYAEMEELVFKFYMDGDVKGGIGAVAEMFHSLKASQFLGGDLRSILQ